jgi:hypothetical protein
MRRLGLCRRQLAAELEFRQTRLRRARCRCGRSRRRLGFVMAALVPAFRDLGTRLRVGSGGRRRSRGRIRSGIGADGSNRHDG